MAIALGEGLLDQLATEAIAGVRQALPEWLDQRADAVVAKIERDRSIDRGDREVLLTALRALIVRHAAAPS